MNKIHAENKSSEIATMISCTTWESHFLMWTRVPPEYHCPICATWACIIAKERQEKMGKHSPIQLGSSLVNTLATKALDI